MTGYKCAVSGCSLISIADSSFCQKHQPGYQSKKLSYRELAIEIGALVESKQITYGDSFSKSGEIIKILYPNGVQPEQYTDLLTITRIIDKLFRIATQKDAYGESPYRDITGYALLGAMKDVRRDAK